MSTISFFTPICFESQNLSTKEFIFGKVESYFYLGGKKARVIPQSPKQVVLESAEPTFFCTALKVASYFTIILPLVLLLFKLYFRSSYQFTVKEPFKPKITPAVQIQRTYRNFVSREHARHFAALKIQRTFKRSNTYKTQLMYAQLFKDIDLKKKRVIVNKLKEMGAFNLIKILCFNGSYKYSKLVELALTEADSKFHGSYKLSSNGGFSLEPKHLPTRMVRGYNPILNTHFVAIKGLVWSEYGPTLSEECQVFCKAKFSQKAWTLYQQERWSRNVLGQFMGGEKASGIADGQFIFDQFDNNEDRIIQGLKIFREAPHIMKLAHTFLARVLKQPLAALVVDYYKCDATGAK